MADQNAVSAALALIASLDEDEKKKVARAVAPEKKLSVKVSENKPVVCVTGLGRNATSLYANQWARLFSSEVLSKIARLSATDPRASDGLSDEHKASLLSFAARMETE